MKKLLIWVVMCLSLTAQAQVGELFGGTINVFAVDDNAGPVFAFRAFFNEAAGRWTGDSTQVGDHVFVFSGNKVYKLTVDSILTAGTIMNLRVRDSTATLASFPTGVCAIMRLTANNMYPATIPGIPNILGSKITTYFAEQADGAGGSSVTAGTKGDINVVGIDSDWQIVSDAVSNAELSNMPANTFKGNNTGSPANPLDLTVSQTRDLAGIKSFYVEDNFAARSVDAKPYDVIYTSGFADANDGGNSSYLVLADSLAGYVTDQYGVIELNNGNYAHLQYEGAYKAESFGVLPSEDSITNRENLQRAVNYATTTDLPNITFDKGTFKFLISTTISFPQDIVNISGKGKDTKFDLYPKIAVSNMALFDISDTDNSNITELSLKDIDFIGADTVSNAAVLYWGMVLAGDGAFRVTFDNVNYTQAGNRIMYSTGSSDTGGKGRVTKIYNSSWSLKASGTTDINIVQLAGGREENYLFTNSCTFTGGGSNNGHQFYIQPWLNWKFENTKFFGFTGGSAGAIQTNQTTAGTWPSWVNTKFQVFDNVYFGSGSYDAINIDKGYFPGVVVTNSVFNNTGGAISGSGTGRMTIDNCYFNTASISLNPTTSDEIIAISNCNFDAGSIGVRCLGNTVKSVAINVNNCNFLNANHSLSTEEASDNNNATIRWFVSDCFFKSSGAQYSVYAGTSSTVGRYYMTLDNCYFEGNAFLQTASSDNIVMRVNRGRWNGGGRLFSRLGSGAGPIDWQVRNFEVPQYTDDWSTADIRVSFDSTANKFPRLHLPDFVFPTDVVIPSDNAPDSLKIGFGIYNIVDTGNRDSITNVYMYDYFAGLRTIGTNYPGFYLAGELRLVAKESFILGSSGNINIAVPFVVKTNYMVRLQYNKTTNEWDCLNCAAPLPDGTVNNATLAFNTTTEAWEQKTNLVNNGSEVAIGTTVNTTYKLAVRADADSAPLQVQDASGSNVLAVAGNGIISIGSNANPIRMYPADISSGGGTPSLGAGTLEIRSPASNLLGVVNIGDNNTSYAAGTAGSPLFIGAGFTRSSGSNFRHGIFMNGSVNITGSYTGLVTGVNLQANAFTWTSPGGSYVGYRDVNPFAPSSGAGNYYSAYFAPTLNQTGTASGEVGGITYAPTVTSVLGAFYGIRSFPAAARSGVGLSTPTALWHIGAGTATLAPFKLTAGTNLTTPENGAIEFDGTSLTLTTGGVRNRIETSPDRLVAEVTTTTTAIKFATLLVDCSAGAVEVDTPASPVAGDWFAVSDSRGFAGTNNITIDTSTDKFHADPDDLILNVHFQYVKLTYVNSTIGWIKSN